MATATYKGVTYDTYFYLPETDGRIGFGPFVPNADFQRIITELEATNPGIKFEHRVEPDGREGYDDFGGGDEDWIVPVVPDTTETTEEN